MHNQASRENTPIALIGIGCRYPGGVSDARSFWDLLMREGDAIGEIPRSRFDLERFHDERPATPGRVMTRFGGFLERLEEFDAAFFGVSPLEAERLDPAQRLVLETAWEGLEDAGIDIASLDGSDTGVFVGQWLSDFEARLFDDPEQVDFYMTTGSGRYATSGRLSYQLGLRGPSLTIDTACSSSLVAVHAAMRSLRQGECRLALAGGVNVILQPHISIAYSQSRMMAADGRCKFGDARGDGYVRSEGAGMVVLKPLAQAERDGDRIYAVLRGSAVNNDGRSSGSMGTPSRAGQEALLRAAQADAGVAGSDVDCIEAHGTGTRAGDPVELGALAAVLAPGRAASRRALVGSVKTNIGHTEGAAGAAGLIKLALSLHHGRIPASLHCDTPTPAIDWPASPVQIVRAACDWPAGPRLAGVSAFGIAGTNAHIVLQGHARPVHEPLRAAPGRPAVLLLSARSREALRDLARTHAAQVRALDRAALDDHCTAAATRRAALSHRAAFIAADASSLAAKLDAYAAGAAADAQGVVHAPAARGAVWVVPGQGGQWTGMACELLAREPAFREALAACDAAARPWLGQSLLELLLPSDGRAPAPLERIELIQPVLVAVAIACARWMESVGVQASAVVGHSMGEVAAAHLAGALDLDTAMRIICRRSALMSRESGRGGMALVELSMADAEQRLAALRDRLSVAVSNGPRSCVVSGEANALSTWLEQLQADGVFCRPIKVDVASHSPQMDVASAGLRAELQGLAASPPSLPMVSTVLARTVGAADLGADYWAANLRRPVRFGEVVQELLSEGATCFVELGLHPVLVTAIEQTAQSEGRAVTALACGRREEPESQRLLAVLAGLWTAGQPVDWRRVLPPARQWVDLPLNPWQRERHWIRQADPLEQRRRFSAPCAAVADEQWAWVHALRWTAAPAPDLAPAGEAWLMGPGAEALARAAQAVGLAAHAVSPAALDAALAGTIPAALVVLCGDEREAAWRPISALQSLARAGRLDGSVRLWLVTCGAQPAAGRCAVHAASAWGAARVIADEHPAVWGGSIDFDTHLDDDGRARRLASELARPQSAQLRWSARGREELRLQRWGESAPVPRMPALRPDASYLITGGLGGVGLEIAAELARLGARRLLLLGRHGLPARRHWLDEGLPARDAARIAAVRRLEAAGVAVQVMEADVADEQSLGEALRRHHDEAWPAIRGVVHAAGTLDNRLALQMDRGALQSVMAAKLDGALLLDKLLPDLDFFVVFSSVSTVLGFSGMANYAAANAGLDALAADRRARGQNAISLQWGPWHGIGMHSGENAEREAEILHRRGVGTLTAAQGRAFFAALAGQDEAALLVAPLDWPTLRAAGHGERGLLAGRAELAAVAGRHSLSERLATADAGERRRLAEPAVREAVGAVLRLAPDRIDPTQPFGTLGLSSLLAMELRNRLETLFARPLSATLAWNYPTVDSLVGFLCGETATAQRPPSAGGAARADAVEIGRMSDDEALQMLRKRR